MKRLNNILSYLWGLLLLLMLTTCSDWEEIVVTMQGEEEVELTIQTNIPSLGGGTTRTAPTEDITSITALAFDSDYELIKVAIEDVTITPSASPSTSGTYKVKVPVRTRRIHFIAKNGGVFNIFSTENNYGDSEDELLQDLTTTELHYWGKLDFANADELKSGGNVTLIRNMAKITLETDGENDHIAGFLNYNIKGTIVPYKDGVLGYQTDTNHDLPTNFDITSDEEEDRNLGKEHYVFEEFNDTINNNTDLVYAICNIDSKYYKIAFKSSTNYYYLIRNLVYNIKISGTLDDKLGKETYADAVQNGQPINDSTKEKVYISFIPDEETTFFIGTTDEGFTRVSKYLGDTGKIKVKIPEGITELQIGYSTINFDAGGVTTTTVTKIGDTETVGNVYVDTYDLTNLGDAREIELSMILKSSITEAIDGLEIQFIGSGELKQSNDKLIVDVVKRADLTVNPTTVSLPKAEGSEFAVTVTIPDYVQGDLSLHIGDIDAKYTITPPDGLVLEKGMYHVTKGMRYTFNFKLNENGEAGDKHTINFDLYSRFFHLTGSTTVTLVEDAVPEQDEYEIWVGDGNAWTGTPDAVDFFGYKTTAESNGFNKNTTPPTGFRTEFYDTGANSHKQQAMVMGSDDSFTFTIPEGESRWLTMLVAADGSNTPSIKLMQGETEWTTSAAAEATTVPANYNFGNGEIGTAGRLIRYELPAGTYTLQGSDAAYLLYYMRVSTERPTMTDIVQPTAADYSLSWSGGEWGNDIKIGDTYFVDDDALTFTPTLSYTGLTLSEISNLTVVTNTYQFEDVDNETGTNITETAETRVYQGRSIPVTLDTNLNAGTYSLSGKATVNNEYKYAAFYDYAQLNAVEFTAKNTIKVNLYNSWDGNATPVTEFVAGGDNNIIGFKMPMRTLPMGLGKDINFTIDNWERNQSGLGIDYSQAPNYKLTSQTQRDQNDENKSYNRIHPRPEWIYKMSWQPASVAENQSITVTTLDTDVYFSYGENIAQTVTIDTPVTGIVENPLDITLDFYAENNVDFNNLTFGETKFYLKTTIPSGMPDGSQIMLNLDTSNGRGGINEWQSWNQDASKGIGYHFNENEVDGLMITTTADQTEYLMCWQYVRSDNNNTNDVSLTYTVSSDTYRLNGETSASITIKGNNQAVDNTGGTTIWSESRTWGDWSAEGYQPNYIELNYFLPVGTEITLNITSANGGAIEMHDCTLTSLRLTSSDVSYPDQGDDYFNVGSGNTSPKFTVPSGGVNGLRINGSNVTITSVVVKYPNVIGPIFSYNFDSGNAINGWGDESYTRPTIKDGSLVLTNDGGFAQAAVDMGYAPGSYTLSYSIKGSVSGSIKQNFQHYYSPKNADGSNGNDVYDEEINNPKDQITEFETDWKSDVSIDITISKGANRLVFDYSEFNGTIYIDNLELVRNK